MKREHHGLPQLPLPELMMHRHPAEVITIGDSLLLQEDMINIVKIILPRAVGTPLLHQVPCPLQLQVAETMTGDKIPIVIIPHLKTGIHDDLFMPILQEQIQAMVKLRVLIKADMEHTTKRKILKLFPRTGLSWVYSVQSFVILQRMRPLTVLVSTICRVRFRVKQFGSRVF